MPATTILMEPAIRDLALCTSAAYAGVALYINLVEHPARMQLDAPGALTQWQHSFSRAAMQPALALVSGIAGGIGAYQTDKKVWMIGSALMLANLPFTLAVIWPINKRLLDETAFAANWDTRADLQNWAQMHAVRTLLGLLGTGVFLYAVCKK